MKIWAAVLVASSYLWSWLVGALCPVTHKGLHQGCTQTSLYLQVIRFTSHHATSHIFWAYLYSADTQHGNLHPLIRWDFNFCVRSSLQWVIWQQHSVSCGTVPLQYRQSGLQKTPSSQTRTSHLIPRTKKTTSGRLYHFPHKLLQSRREKDWKTLTIHLH